MNIYQTTKEGTPDELRRCIRQHRPCSYFVITSKDEGINNGYQDVASGYDDEYFSENYLIVIKEK